MKAAITIEVDTDRLEGLRDEYLAALWYVTQANPAPIEDRQAGQLAEHVGRAIITRFLKSTPPLLWDHQGKHADWCELQKAKEEASGAPRYSAPPESFTRVGRDEALPWDDPDTDTGEEAR